MKDPRIWSVIQAAALVLSGRSAVADAIGTEASKMLALEIPEQTGTFSKSMFPVTSFIGEALKHGTSSTRPFLDVLAHALPYLPWKYNYPPPQRHAGSRH